MIPLLIGFAFGSPLSITHDLKSTYLYQNPVVITFQIQNTSDKKLVIPDISSQTWRASFVLTHKGKKETRRNEKKESIPTWTLNPNGIRIVRLEIPGGNTLPQGEYNLSLLLDYQSDKYEYTQKISIQKPKQKSLDLKRSLSGKITALWTDDSTKGTYYHSGSHQYYTHPFSENPKLIVHKNTEPYDFFVYKRMIHIRGKRPLKVSIPYPDAQALARMSLYDEHYFLPLWRPKAQKLMLMQIDKRGVPLFRKTRDNMPTPISTDTTQSALGVPLYLIHHAQGVELLQAYAPKEASWPINSKYIYKATSKQEVLAASFATHPQEGISIFLLYREEDNTYKIWLSLSGTILSKEEFPKPPKGVIIDSYAPQSAILLKEDSNLLYLSKTEKKSLPSSQSCRLNKSGLVCFHAGNWTIKHRYPQSTDEQK
jgi:hypothetical protein